MIGKDYFSQQAKAYVKYRPLYPMSLYAFLLNLQPARQFAWDCGTGNGQVAGVLAQNFDAVMATDISKKQISQAEKLANVRYAVCAVEQTPIANQSVDLITVGQALHWFDWDAFYAEVRRVAKPNAVIAAWTYDLYRVSEAIEEVTYEIYSNILGEQYWAKERKLIDQHYATIPFPFKEVKQPPLLMQLTYTFEQLMGYLSTWSAVNTYIQVNGENPLDQIRKPMAAAWGDVTKSKIINWDIYMRVGYCFG